MAQTTKRKPAASPSRPEVGPQRKRLVLAKETIRDLTSSARQARAVKGGAKVTLTMGVERADGC